ncbi:hypothetical protein BCV69DRAFT_296040 [Microstroma glucosiphilum]|uniref:Mediator of RNA polymerase II transcription subunit 31 n=1 Tax=Pseudomicrostroma glucosiphilum TaxID=1684307 RepID=A0A316UIF4_9BASI|nr:hypothetical protein BCV69DRAFT_296040 [Pseudomicrostroma glucosiphilum]PWN23723.1 hypothetical protein BCV69DRAFT_296040 [Pseudomicrostroma glucosiphilum]
MAAAAVQPGQAQGAPEPSAASQSPLRAHHELLVSRQFTLQLELLSSLSSPSYIHHLTLAASPTTPAPLSDPAFIRYLAHLHTIWSRPEYARYVHYPNGLYFCRLLVSSAAFRDMVARQGHEWEGMTAQRLIQHWETWRREDDEEEGGNGL